MNRFVPFRDEILPSPDAVLGASPFCRGKDADMRELVPTKAPPPARILLDLTFIGSFILNIVSLLWGVMEIFSIESLTS